MGGRGAGGGCGGGGGEGGGGEGGGGEGGGVVWPPPPPGLPGDGDPVEGFPEALVPFPPAGTTLLPVELPEEAGFGVFDVE